MSSRYFFHIRHGEHGERVSIDDEGTEFASAREADDYGARVACDISMDDFHYGDAEVSVVDASGNEIARHPFYPKLNS
ncbi:hypothetical protein [Bradyrhizobium sp. Gha]|uniref:DUF6894 family protein n=1 Tax=Bradyrhizobium sp. Gha TaxID=1855318 RepID=UPI0008DF96CF|nr:hypothetical protein [Bradyrhizobium sp. Gha]SFH66874.1 hypothetical protein SAMN05216525_101181 [Bradyrhizobium sp. Gha]